MNPDLNINKSNLTEPAKFGQVRNRQIKLNNFKEPISFERVHVGEEITQALIGKFDTNVGYDLDVESTAELFAKGINALISEDGVITDEALDKFVEENKDKSWKLNKKDIITALTTLFGSKENNPFDENLREVKIGEQTIYIGEKIEDEIDLKPFLQHNGKYLPNTYLNLYRNYQTQKIDHEIEVNNLLNVYYSCLDENGELSDDKIKEFLESDKHTKGIRPGSFKDFLLQMLAPEKTPEEKEQYYNENKKRIKTITSKYNRLNKPTQDKNILIGKSAIKTFQTHFGKPDSASMEYVIEKEYYERDPDLAERFYAVRRDTTNTPLAELVKKYKVANCQEDTDLTIDILREKYPNKRLFEISFMDNDGYADTDHVAVMIFDNPTDEKNAEFYKSNDFNQTNIDQYLKNVTVIDNWFGGVFKGDEWVKMQSELHSSENFNVKYYEREQ